MFSGTIPRIMKANIKNTPVADFTSINIEERKNLGIRAGDTVKVWVKIKEKDKVRLQAFEGLVLSAKHGTEPGATFTVRKVSGGVGVERIFPLFSPNIDKIEIIKRASVRRSKLYHLREKVAREIKRQMRKTKFLYSSTSSDIEEQEKIRRAAEEEAAQIRADEEAKVAAEAESAAAEAAKVAEEAAKVAAEAAPVTPEVVEAPATEAEMSQQAPAEVAVENPDATETPSEEKEETKQA